MATKQNLYILVADSARAKVFRAETPLEKLEPVYDQVNFQGRKKSVDTYSDRPGRKQTDRGGSHGFGGENDPHEVQRFSRELCQFLCDEHRKSRFDSLILIAPPHFLGVLRDQLHGECRQVLLSTIDKDLVKMTDTDIIGRILAGNPELNKPAMLGGHGPA